jgi:transcriptional regulator with XRE-family HTH domain
MARLEPDQIKRIAERLNALRRREGLSQRAVGEALGIAQSTYSDYEAGRRCPRLNALIKLAVFYHVSMDYIAGRTDDETPKW